MAGGVTAAAVFPAFDRFREAVGVFNSITTPKLAVVLQRILRTLGSAPTAAAFSAEEVVEVAAVLGVSEAGATVAAAAAAYIFERAGLYGLKAPVLLALLADTGLGEAPVTHFSTVWASDGAAFVAAARSRAAATGVPWLLSDVSTQLALGVGSGAATGIKTTTAVLQFDLVKPPPSVAAAGAATVAAGAAAMPPATAAFQVEFSRDALLAFLEKLDAMAQQIDALSA